MTPNPKELQVAEEAARAAVEPSPSVTFGTGPAVFTKESAPAARR